MAFHPMPAPWATISTWRKSMAAASIDTNAPRGSFSMTIHVSTVTNTGTAPAIKNLPILA